MFNATPSTALHRLLDRSQHFAPEYGGGLSNHLPMALAALDGIGADPSQMKAFFDSYTPRLQPTASTVLAEPVADWSILRGHFDAYTTLRSTFASELQGRGRDAVLRSAMPLLVSGVAAAAFHGVIRVAHAVQSGHRAELAAALAYWAARWMPLPAPDAVEPDIDDVTDWLRAIDTTLLRDDAAWSPSASQIDDRMRDSIRTAAYRLEAGRLRTEGRDIDALLARLSRTAAARYAGTRSFIVLHIATAARAARVLAPWLPSDEAALQPLWHAVAAASLAAGTARMPSRESRIDTELDWPQVLALARASEDEHAIKLVHAMSTQNEVAAHADWLRAAVAGVAVAG